MKIYLKTEGEIEQMRRSNQLVAATLAEVGRHIKPGVSTLHLDKVAEDFIRSHGATPTFKNFPNPFGPPFPNSVCTSVNAIVVHGVPNARTILKEGDIISVDCGVKLDGFCGDSCYTFTVGEVRPEVQKLIDATQEALRLGIDQARDGNYVGDIGHAVQKYCEGLGYGVVRELTGHGIGREMHEDPEIPNYGKPHTGIQLKEGMCIAIEPMITMGSPQICLLPDKWSIMTRDSQWAAHFEHTVVVKRGGGGNLVRS